MKYNLKKIHEELVNAGVIFDGVYLDVKIDDGIEQQTLGIHLRKDSTEENKALAKSIVDNHISYDYREFRRNNYDIVGDQLDCIYKGLKSFMTDGNWGEINTWIAKIDQVKNKYKKDYNDLDSETKLEVN